jgi:hypothetical protein
VTKQRKPYTAGNRCRAASMVIKLRWISADVLGVTVGLRRRRRLLHPRRQADARGAGDDRAHAALKRSDHERRPARASATVISTSLRPEAKAGEPPERSPADKGNRPEKGGWKTRPVLGADWIARARGRLEGDLLHHMLHINYALLSRQHDDSVAVLVPRVAPQGGAMDSGLGMEASGLRKRHCRPVSRASGG